MKKIVISGLMLGLWTIQGANMAGKKTIAVTSDAFDEGGDISTVYTCDGRNYSPAISWEKIDGAVTYALICEDPDVSQGPFIHWIVFNIPGNVYQLPAQAIPEDMGALEGNNSSGEPKFMGPCPPPNEWHRYYFTVYALDAKLSLKKGITITPFKEALEGHIIAQGSLMGRYKGLSSRK